MKNINIGTAMNKLFNTKEEAKSYALGQGLKSFYLKKILGKYRVITPEERLREHERNNFLNEALGPCYGQE